MSGSSRAPLLATLIDTGISGPSEAQTEWNQGPQLATIPAISCPLSSLSGLDKWLVMCWCWVPGQPQNSSALYCVEREWPRTQQAGLSWPQHCCTVTNTGYRTLQPPHRFRFPHSQCISWHLTWISYQLFLISTLTKSLHLNWSDSHFTCQSWK